MGRFRKNKETKEGLAQFAPTYNVRQFNAGLTAFDPLTRTKGISSVIHERRSRSKSRKSAKSVKTTSSRSRSKSKSVNPNDFANSGLFIDKQSREIMDHISRSHKNPKNGKMLIFKEGEKLKKLTKDNVRPSPDTLTYDQMLQELIVDGEILMQEQGIEFNKVETEGRCDGKKAFIRPNLVKGRMFLTNARLLFLSAEPIKATTLNLISNGKRKSFYEVASFCNEEHHYQYLPLSCMKSIELQSRAGGKAEVDVQGLKPKYGGLFSCFGEFFGAKSFQEKWTKNLNGCLTVQYNDKVLLIGAEIPPWKTKALLRINISEEVSLEGLIGYISVLQQMVPTLCGMKNGWNCTEPPRILNIVREKANPDEAVKQYESSDDPYVVETKKEYEELPHTDVYIYHPTLQMRDSLITEKVPLEQAGIESYFKTEPLPKTPEEENGIVGNDNDFVTKVLIHSVDNPDLPPEEWTAIKEPLTSSSSEEEVFNGGEEKVSSGNENEREEEIENDIEEKKEESEVNTNKTNGYVNCGFITDEKVEYESISSLSRIKCACPKCLENEKDAHWITDSNINSQLNEVEEESEDEANAKKHKDYKKTFCPCDHCLSKIVNNRLQISLEDDQTDINNAQTLPIR
ncbi:DgyrCDS6228 [Dimorphilus gyrociliatus]|uniref:DgyrCDS6228 n=1 Tax=Dimorphilus gyrociliatus TaxID=2664684 RepID=A0A7I8VPS4_9ANNE|nr:DgyrCDS6228 [Dimorphilus gyrociliatus]